MAIEEGLLDSVGSTQIKHGRKKSSPMLSGYGAGAMGVHQNRQGRDGHFGAVEKDRLPRI